MGTLERRESWKRHDYIQTVGSSLRYHPAAGHSEELLCVSIELCDVLARSVRGSTFLNHTPVMIRGLEQGRNNA